MHLVVEQCKSYSLSYRGTSRKQHAYFVHLKIKWAAFHPQKTKQHNVSGLYAVYFTSNYFTMFNNTLHAKISWSCFLVMFLRRKLHVASKSLFGHGRKCVAQIKSIEMFGSLYIHYLWLSNTVMYLARN